MLFNRAEIKENAKAAFKANYWAMVGYTLLGAMIVSAACFIPFGNIILLFPISAGYSYFMYKVYRGDGVNLENMFIAFKDGRFGHVLGGCWYMSLFLFLWSIVPMLVYIICIALGEAVSPAFIVFGVIAYIALLVILVYKGIQYSMVSFILIDMPEVGATAAVKKSIEMTEGYKKDIFVFELSFIGWMILSSFTCGLVGIFYVNPYMEVACAGLYDFLKKANGLEQGTPAPEAPIFEKVED